MNVLRCKNGHFYDGDTYDRCPHCGADGNGKGGSEIKKENTNSKIKAWPWLKPKTVSGTEKQQVQAQTAPLAEDYRPTSSGSQQRKEPPAPTYEKPTSIPSRLKNLQNKGSETISAWDPEAAENLDYGNGTAAPDYNGSPYSEPYQEITPQPAYIPPVMKDPVFQKPVPEPQKEPEQSLHAAVSSVSASSAGKTVSFFQSMSEEKKASPSAVAVDPVVGWLVSIGGPHFGEAFTICAGKNTIGRSANNRIVFSRDEQVSREKHAIIIYEPRKRQFYLQPGDSSGLTYLNDDFIAEQRKLSEKDTIEIGGSKLLFVPLCGDSFSWDELKN